MSFNDSQGDDSPVREGRYSTGIKILDSDILRGIPKGSTIAIVGEPDSASELILHSLAATGRNTEYITTLRSDYGLIEEIKKARVEERVDESEVEDNVTIRDVFSSTEEPGDIIRKALQFVNDGGNFIMDSFSLYHDSPQQMLDFARKIHTKTKMNQGISYIYFSCEKENLTRHEKEVLQLVDGVFYVKTEHSGDNIENNLFINKLRGMKLPKEGQNLIFGEKLSIDVTSDIG